MDFFRDLQQEVDGMAIDVRGKGLLIGCELASDELASELSKRCLEQGVIVNVVHGKVLRIFPALNIELALLKEGLGKIGEVVREL